METEDEDQLFEEGMRMHNMYINRNFVLTEDNFVDFENFRYLWHRTSKYIIRKARSSIADIKKFYEEEMPTLSAEEGKAKETEMREKHAYLMYKLHHVLKHNQKFAQMRTEFLRRRRAERASTSN